MYLLFDPILMLTFPVSMLSLYIYNSFFSGVVCENLHQEPPYHCLVSPRLWGCFWYGSWNCNRSEGCSDRKVSTHSSLRCN